MSEQAGHLIGSRTQKDKVFSKTSETFTAFQGCLSLVSFIPIKMLLLDPVTAQMFPNVEQFILLTLNMSAVLHVDYRVIDHLKFL